MTGLVETPVWEPEIYQWETDDPVEGGPDGIDNVPTRQLANRSQYLKQEVESTQAGQAAHAAAADPHPQYAPKLNPVLTAPTVAAAPGAGDNSLKLVPSTWVVTAIATAIADLVASSPAALDTLNEIAAALGNDANFAATITNALALKAPLASPVFTGNPEAPTPAQFDATTKLATMEALQRALGNFKVGQQISANIQLTAAMAGSCFQVVGALTITLPSVLTGLSPAGVSYTLFNNGSDWTINSATANIFNGSSQVSSMVVKAGTSITVVVTDDANWFVLGTGAMPHLGIFAASLVANGYQRLPSGMIVQLGEATGSASGDVTVTFPLAFPNACLQAFATPNAAGAGYMASSNTRSQVSFKVGTFSTTSARVAAAFSYFAIGW